MALCVVLNPDGTLQPTGEPPESCAGYLLVSGAELSVMQTFSDALVMPTAEEAAGVFATCVGMILGFYVVGSYVGAVLRQFRGR